MDKEQEPAMNVNAVAKAAILSTADVVHLARMHHRSFIMPFAQATIYAATSDYLAIIDVSHFPDWLELRVAEPNEQLTLAIASDYQLLLDYAEEHGVPIVDEEDQPARVDLGTDQYERFHPYDNPEETFGGMPGDFEGEGEPD